MFCAVAELHKLGYIHRDLKPEVHTDLVSATGGSRSRRRLRRLRLVPHARRTSSSTRRATSSSPTLGSRRARSTRARSSTSRTRSVRLSPLLSFSKNPLLTPCLACTPAARLGRRLAAHPALDARDEVDVQVDPDGRRALRRLGRRLARLHGDRDAARAELQLLGRLLEPRLHPLRVRPSLPRSLSRHARPETDPRPSSLQVPRRLPALLGRLARRDVAQPQELAARPAAPVVPPARGPHLQPVGPWVGRHHAPDRAQGVAHELARRRQAARVLCRRRVGRAPRPQGAVHPGARLGDRRWLL